MYPVHWSSKVSFWYQKMQLMVSYSEDGLKLLTEIARIKTKILKAGLLCKLWLTQYSQWKMNFFKKACENLEYYSNGKIKFNTFGQ